ncbi:MAG: type III-B CRISPR module RAMP protein Cmr6, partial [Chitinophagales bacterium]
YYNGDKPPADYHNPIPIFFLTVDKKTQFQFILGSKSSEWLTWTFKNNKKEEKDIIWWLQDALQNHGIGAKTAVGYGYMKPS